jgi:hypothetical protein
MTIQDLKENRSEIIEYINSNGYDLKFAMDMAVSIAANCRNLAELLDELRFNCKPVKSSRLSEMVSNAHQDEKFDIVKKEWVKQ